MLLHRLGREGAAEITMNICRSDHSEYNSTKNSGFVTPERKNTPLLPFKNSTQLYLNNSAEEKTQARRSWGKTFPFTFTDQGHFKGYYYGNLFSVCSQGVKYCCCVKTTSVSKKGKEVETV